MGLCPRGKEGTKRGIERKRNGERGRENKGGEGRKGRDRFCPFDEIRLEGCSSQPINIT